MQSAENIRNVTVGLVEKFLETLLLGFWEMLHNSRLPLPFSPKPQNPAVCGGVHPTCLRRLTEMLMIRHEPP